MGEDTFFLTTNKSCKNASDIGSASIDEAKAMLDLKLGDIVKDEGAEESKTDEDEVIILKSKISSYEKAMKSAKTSVLE